MLFLFFTLVLSSGNTESQEQPRQRRTKPDYSLRPGAPEFSAFVGDLIVDTSNGGPITQSLTFGGNIGFGITRGLSAQVGGSWSNYLNDKYYAVDVTPHNPYLLTADLLTFWGGLRYEFGGSRWRARPFVEGGAGAITFANVSQARQGPICFLNPDAGVVQCVDPTPGYFTGTKAAGYFAGGMNFALRERWGVQAGLRGMLPSKGALQENYWYSTLNVGLYFRP